MGKNEIDISWCWTPSLSVGVQAIDEDHKRLFTLFNDARLMSEADNEDVSVLYGLAHELVLYMRSHFNREEALMIASNYPSCKPHFAAHSALIEEVLQKFDEVVENNESISEFVVFLKDIFVAHIQGNDQQISEYTKGFETEIEKALAAVGPLSLSESINTYGLEAQ